jgi:hypothetical protein
VNHAQRQQKADAQRIVVETQTRRSDADCADQSHAQARFIEPALELGFDEPIEQVIGLYESQYGTQPRVEAEVANAEHPCRRGSHAAEVAAPVLGDCRDYDRCRGRSDENDGDRQQIARSAGPGQRCPTEARRWP